MDHVDITQEPPVIVSLCTGIRGIERGLERALGCTPRIAAYVEVETFIVENLLAAMEAGLVATSPIWCNLKTFPFQSFHGRLHGLIGGYPCTPFSLAGQRLGDRDPRHLWPFIRKGIQSARPIWCFFENVDDHLTMGFDVVYKDLRQMGYVVETGIFSAEEVGAPHERQRLYIFAIRQEMAYTDGYDPGRIIGNVLRTQRESHAQKDKRQRHRDEPGDSGKTLPDTGVIGVRQSGGEQQSELIKPDGLSGRTEELENTGSERGDGRRKGSEGGRTRSGDVAGPGGEVDDTEGIRLQGQSDVGRSGIDAYATDRGWRRWLARTDTAFVGWPAGQGDFQYPYEEPRVIESGLEYTINGYNFTGDLHRAIGNSVVEQTAEKAFITLIHKHIKTAKYGKGK